MPAGRVRTMHRVEHGELARRTLPAVPSSVREARAFVAQVLDGVVGDDLHDAALLVISELSANAMLHAETPFDVVVRGGPGDIRLEVHDRNPRLPRRKRYSSESTTGRGLVLVEALTTVAGAERTADGKVVWAILSEVPPPPPTVSEQRGAEVLAPADLGLVEDPSPGGDLQVAAREDGPVLRARQGAEERVLALVGG